MTHTIEPYGGWNRCAKLSNGLIELVATLDVGPRILRLGFVSERNLFHEVEEDRGITSGKKWRPFGGHRLWHAPEVDPRTYHPDFDAVHSSWEGGILHLRQDVEPATGIQKEIFIRMDPRAAHVEVRHRLTNRGAWDVRLAPWALSVMAPGGVAIFPQEEYRPHPDYLLPARPIVLWHYTDMTDPRFRWGRRFILVRQDITATTRQKIGLLNKQGWSAYVLDSALFVKRHGHEIGGDYPDLGCNTECYTDEAILEVESLGPLTSLAPGASVDHVERWELHSGTWDTTSETALATALEPLVGPPPAWTAAAPPSSSPIDDRPE